MPQFLALQVLTGEQSKSWPEPQAPLHCKNSIGRSPGLRDVEGIVQSR
jgi:hypothetical protein